MQLRIENPATVMYCYTIFCTCGWAKNVIPAGTEVSIALKMMKQETNKGCRECGSQELFIKNITNQG
jgi:hypothetical protein